MEGEQENFTQEEIQPDSNLKKQFTTVTTLSKYLALTLFVALPFIGGWAGYKLAPVKVIEVEKVAVKNLDTKNELDTTFEENQLTEKAVNESGGSGYWRTFRNAVYGIEFNYPEHLYALYFSHYSDGLPIFAMATEETDADRITFSATDFTVCEGLCNAYEYSLWLEISKEGSSSLTEDSEIIDDFWSKLGKYDGEQLVNKLIEKKTVNGIDFIIFNQYTWSLADQTRDWYPQAVFVRNNNIFWVRGKDSSSTELFNQIISTFKSLE